MAIIYNHQLKIARESRGLTQTQLAKSITNLSQSNLSKMEQGLLPVTGEALVNIANALNYPVSFFYKKNQQPSDGTFYYRKRITLTKSILMKIEAQRDILRMAVDELLQSVEVKECYVPHIPATDDMTPSDIARKVRAFLKVPKGPVQEPIKLLEDAGIIVYEMDFHTDKLMGFTIYTDMGQPIIFINKNMPNDRKRFTLAHELGHLVMHISFDVYEDDKVIEQQADEFASEFNMPLLDCLSDIQNLKFSSLNGLKLYWKCSKAAILRRALTAKTISPDRYKYFMIELSRIGERKTEKGIVDLDKPQLLNQILELHIKDLHYSKTEIAQMISISEKDCNELLFPAQRVMIRLTPRISSLQNEASY